MFLLARESQRVTGWSLKDSFFSWGFTFLELSGASNSFSEKIPFQAGQDQTTEPGNMISEQLVMCDL